MINSIIIVNNNSEYLDKCLDSIIKFTNMNLCEIIVVTKSLEKLENVNMKGEDFIKQVVLNEDLSFPRFYNEGIQVSSGDNIIFLKCDVIVTPRWLDNLLEGLHSSNLIGAVAPCTNKLGYNQNIDVLYKNIDEMIMFADKFNISDCEKWEERLKLTDTCMVIKRGVIDKIGGFDEKFAPSMYEIDDYCMRMINNKYHILLCKDTFIHRTGIKFFLDDEYKKVRQENMKIFEEKWGFNLEYSTSARTEIVTLITEEKEKSLNILEVGCACGATLLDIKNKYKNSELYGIEINENCSEIADKFFDISNIDIEKLELKYPTDFFDYIIFADVLEHLLYPEKVLEKIKKHLKTGGKVLISIPNIMHYSIIKDLINGVWEYKESGILDKTHIRFFTLNTIKNTLQTQGYDILTVKSNKISMTNQDNEFINNINKMVDVDVINELETYQYIIKAENI